MIKPFAACSIKNAKNQISFLFISVMQLWYAPSCPGAASTLAQLLLNITTNHHNLPEYVLCPTGEKFKYSCSHSNPHQISLLL